MHYNRRFVGYFMGTYQAILWAADPAGAACRFPKRQGNGDTWALASFASAAQELSR